MEIYDYLVNNKENKYKNEFDTKWKHFLDNLNLPYTTSKILYLGNRFRPRLVYFAYLFSNNTTPEDFSKVTEVGVCIEALHKASLIIDDIVDNDNMRYGYCSFHNEFSVNETIAFSVHLIGKSCSLLNRTFYENVNDNEIIIRAMDLYFNTISNMTYGALLEMQNFENSIQNVKMISRLETGTLITNSLLLGYLMGNDVNEEVIKIFSEIGNKCGQLYQFLNDLEPFLNPQFNIQHKGKVNLDFDNCRKNIIITFFRRVLGNEEIDRLVFEDVETVKRHIFNLMKNRQISNMIKNEIESCYYDVNNLMKCLKLYSENRTWHEKFHAFFEETLKWGTIRSKLQRIEHSRFDN